MRNKRYFWWSKLLKEVVKLYGDDNRYNRGNLKTPLFCGMSYMMNLPQFAIKLLSPTSTTTELAVSMKFSGDTGIIIEFNNNGDYANRVKAFDVSIMSRFKEEDERYRYLYILHFISI